MLHGSRMKNPERVKAREIKNIKHKIEQMRMLPRMNWQYSYMLKLLIKLKELDR
jgi:hypothetical protein